MNIDINWNDAVNILNLQLEKGGLRARGKCINHNGFSNDSMVMYQHNSDIRFVCYSRNCNPREIAYRAVQRIALNQKV